MFADRGVLRVCKIASAAAGWAILPGLLAVVLLSSSAAFADDPPWDRWWRVEKPSKEECDAAREWDKATDAWIDLCGEGRDKQSAPKAPPMEQQLAAEAEKRCIEENAKDRDAYEACLTNARLAIFPAAAAENRCIENVKDHEAWEACLTNVRLKIILANSPAIQAQCSRRTGDDLIDCVDLIYVYGGRLKDMLAANLKQVSLKEWGKQVEEEWQARKADPERRKQSGSQCGGPGGAGQRWQVKGNELHGCPCGYGLKPTPGAFGAWCSAVGTPPGPPESVAVVRTGTASHSRRGGGQARSGGIRAVV